MAKPKVVVDEDMRDLSIEIHLALFSLTKIYKTTPEFQNVYEKVRF